MIAFEISIDGQQTCTAGVSGLGVTIQRRASRSPAASYPAHPEQALVKVAAVRASGSREHVWAQLKALGAETLTATILTPLLDPPSGAEERLVVPVAELEDWHVFLPDGRIRGSFTTQAQLQVCRATGQPIPRELRGIEGRFVDA